MFLSKLVSVIGALDKGSYRRLREYLSSPYFKISSGSVDLFDYLDTLYPDFPEHKMKPEVIGKASSNLSTRGKAAKAGSELLKSVEHFLALEDWDKQEQRVKWHQYNALQKLELLVQYEAEFKKD